jgi:hypothetical protein
MQAPPAQFNRRHLVLGLPALVATLDSVASTSTDTSLAPKEIANALASPKRYGTSRLRFLAWDVYDISLWTETHFEPANFIKFPFALELTYLRAIKGLDIATQSLKEMQRLGPMSKSQENQWLVNMQAAFPNVQPGDRLCGLHQPGQRVRFFHNGALRTEIDDAAFAPFFFGIWLSDKTSEPRLRSELLKNAPL